MFNLEKEKDNFLNVCKDMKGLSPLTIKAYSIDLNQFCCFMKNRNCFNKDELNAYIQDLYMRYKPKSAKRKIACIKSFYRHMEIEDIIEFNPFHKITLKYKESIVLPKTIPLNYVNNILAYAYSTYQKADTKFQKEISLRNIIVIELLFSTGMRVSEVSQLKVADVNLSDGTLRIFGKGSKERIMCISEMCICRLIENYLSVRSYNLEHIFVNKLGNRLSEQSIRNMIDYYAKAADIPLHITPHMFRHTFATELHNEEIDIRYIQQFLGHSSITTTQIYTHISASKTRDILKAKHPRNKMTLPIHNII